MVAIGRHENGDEDEDEDFEEKCQISCFELSYLCNRRHCCHPKARMFML